MIINRLLIKNYKNIENIEFIFKNKSINYITGENSVGKSNIINVIYKIFTGKYCLFSEEDFGNYEKPIEIECEIDIDDDEIFNDLIEIDDNKNLGIFKYTQNKDNYIWNNNGIESTKNYLNNFVCYRYVPRDFKDDFITQSNGIKKLINDFIDDQLEGKELNLINPFSDLLNKYNDEIAKKFNNIFESILKIPSPELELNIERMKVSNILLKLFELVNLNLDNKKLFINHLGRGRGYYLYPIIDFIAFIYVNKEKIIKSNIIILFDEPEVYLSPFLQRQFMDNWISLDKNMINTILNIRNKNIIEYNIEPRFFISTHSSLIIPHLDFNEIINRFSIHRVHYNDENKISVSSLKNKIAELKQFSTFDRNILEGLFAKKIILVEGDTEVGFLPLALKNCNINIHEKHIYIIKAAPCNFYNLASIFNELNIKTYILTDRDYNRGCNDDTCERVKNLINNFNKNNNVMIFVSDYWDFEESILICLKKNYNEIYNSIKESKSDEIDIETYNTHFKQDKTFIRKLEYMRSNNKTIEDNYELINKLIHFNNNLSELDNIEGDICFNYCDKIAADYYSEIKMLPNYILSLIEELKKD